jgi:hypothetical protein
MKETITGLMTLFNAGCTFNTSIGGRLFYSVAPAGTNLADGSYAIFFVVSNVDEDTFSENQASIYIQFSLYSGTSSPAEILDMETYLTAMLKDKTFPVSGATVVHSHRLQSNGPTWTKADMELGTEGYWSTDVDFLIYINRS